MTTRFVGIGGNDANSGLTWALRKLTLNGVEDTPVAAGDTVYVGPGTYREVLTLDVSGTAGNPITYVGDYSGVNTDGVGGVVRITGSDDDIAFTRTNCITGAARSYRTFQNLWVDSASSYCFISTSNGASWIIDKCFISSMGLSVVDLIRFSGTGTGNTVQNCYLELGSPGSGIMFTHTSTVDSSLGVVNNNIFMGGASGVTIFRIGDISIKNNTFLRKSTGVQVGTAMAAGHPALVYNNLFQGCATALVGITTADITENYNNFSGCSTPRTNTSTGANSTAKITLFDPRWFFEAVR